MLIKKIYKKIVLDISYIFIPKDKIKITNVSINNQNIVVFQNEDVGRRLSCFKDFEKPETNFFKEFIKPDDICFDVGGNVGYFSLLFSNIANRGTVHVFEPIYLNNLLIKINLEINGIKNVVLNQFAVGDAAREVSFSISEDSAFSSINSTGRIREKSKISVQMVSIDDYLTKNNIPRIDVLKIDVEGAEGLVVTGSSKILSDPARRPRIILIELYDPNLSVYGTSKSIIVEKMKVNGYSSYVVDEYLGCIPYVPENHNKFYNIIFKLD